MFGLLIGIVFILLLILVCYLIINLTNLSFMSKIKNKYFRLLISIIPLIVIFFLFNVVNSIVIIFHFSIFILISKLLFKAFKQNKNYNLVVLIGAILTAIYLCVGAYLDYHVFETRYEVKTSKEIGMDKLRIVQISDSHIGTTFDFEGFKRHIDKISKIDMDLFVITGDFVDDDTTKEDMIKSCEALSLINPKFGKYFIYGNHDRGYFSHKEFNEKELIDELNKNGVKILKDEAVEINEYIYLVGREDKSIPRKSIDEITRDLDKDKFIIDLNHQPNDYKNEKEAKVDLVLSGHTHGGQLFPLGYVGVLFGANDMFKGIKKIDGTTFIVNTGLSDWAMDFKTGTKSEYVIIDVIKE